MRKLLPHISSLVRGDLRRKQQRHDLRETEPLDHPPLRLLWRRAALPLLLRSLQEMVFHLPENPLPQAGTAPKLLPQRSQISIDHPCHALQLSWRSASTPCENRRQSCWYSSSTARP